MGGLYININYFDSKSDTVKFTLPNIKITNQNSKVVISKIGGSKAFYILICHFNIYILMFDII
jgi:hypothetical protein